MSLYPQLPEYPPKPIQPTPSAINRARKRHRATPPGSVQAADGKICPIVYGRHYMRPYLGAVLYGSGPTELQQLECIGMAWMFCLGEIEDYERIYFNDQFLFGWPNASHGSTYYFSGGAYNYYGITTYFGKPDQVVDPTLAAMNQVTMNYSEGYTDANVYTENGLGTGQAYIVTVQNKLYDKELQLPSAIVKGLKVYDPRTTTTIYSENPALHLADFLSSEYGAKWTPDWQSIGEAADFCDELIDGKKRNRGGFIINGQAPIDDIIERMRALAGVVVRKEGSTFYLVIDRAGSSVFTFNTSNIIRDSFGLAYRPLLDKPTKIEVEFTRARRNGFDVKPPWLLDTVSYPGPGDPGYSSDVDERRVARVELHDCQDVDVAVRYAKKMWFRQQDSVWRVRLETRDMAAALYQGEVVTVDHPNLPSAANPMLFMIRQVAARHTMNSLTYVLELEQYAPTSYIDEPTSEPNPYPDLSEPPGGESGATVIPLYSTTELAKDHTVLVNIEAFPDDYCGLADASTGIRAEGYVNKGEGSNWDAVEGAYIVNVNANEGLMDDVDGTITKGRVFLGNAGAVGMSPPTDAVITQDIGTGEPSDRVLFSYADPEITKWRGIQSGAGPWYPGEMVQSSGWLMRCLKTTTDPAAPQQLGDLDWLVEDDETYSMLTATARVVTGHVYNFDEFATISGYRIYVPDSTLIYDVSFWDATDIDAPSVLSALRAGPGLSIGWNELATASGLLVAPNSVLMMQVAYDKRTPASSFTHQWNFQTGASGGDPGSGNAAREADHTRLYISTLDNSGTDRSTSLATLVIGDSITITEAADATRWLEYSIDGAPIAAGTYYEYPVELTAYNGSVRNNRLTTIFGEHFGGTANADVPRDLDYWIGSAYSGKVKGFNVSAQSDIPQNMDNSLYMADIKVVLLQASADWDFMAYSSEATAITGASGEVRSVNSALPDANGNIEFVRLGIAESAPNATLELKTDYPDPMFRISEGSSGDIVDIDGEGVTTFHRTVSAQSSAFVTGPIGSFPASSMGLAAATGRSEITAIGTDGSTYGDLLLRSVTGTGAQRWLLYGHGTSGNVGVNTTTPDARFHIQGGSDVTQLRVQAWGFENRSLIEAVNFDNSLVHFCVSETGNTGVGTVDPQAELHIVNTSSEPALRIDEVSVSEPPLIVQDDGRVGIGIETPTTKLQVVGGITDVALSLGDNVTDGADSFGRLAGLHYTKTEKPVAGVMIAGLSFSNVVSIGGGSGFMNAATSVEFFTAANSTTSTGTLRARIDNQGRFGIGITVPEAALHVVSTTDTVSFRTTAFSGQTSNILEVKGTSGSDELVVASNGRLGVKTAVPTEALHVTGNILLEQGQELKSTDYKGDNRSLLRLDATGDFNIFNNAGGVGGQIRFRNAAGALQNMVLLPSGSLGIGQAAPVVKLEVNGAIGNDFEFDAGDSRVTKTINFADGNSQRMTMTAGCTVTLNGGACAGHMTLRTIQDTVPRTLTWANLLAPGGTIPPITSSAGAVDLWHFYYDGTNFHLLAHAGDSQ